MRGLILFTLVILLTGTSNAADRSSMDEAIAHLKNTDYEKAVPILKKLSAEGVTEAQVQLAVLYIGGIGVPRNAEAGMELYVTASGKGNSTTQFVLATELFKGQLIPPDRKRALSLLLSSAKQRYALAQFGLCVEQSIDESEFYDAIEAYAWCVASSKKDHNYSRRAAQRATETLGKILVRQGAESVQVAKTLASKYSIEY
jgi:TPR repeat protein